MNTCDSNNDYQSNFLQPRPFFDQNSKEVHLEEFPSPNFFQFYNNIPYELELEDHMFFLQQQYYDHLLLQHHQLPWTDPPPPPPSADQDVIVPDIALNMAADDESSKAESNNTNGLVICNQLQQMMPIMSNNKKIASSKKDRHSKINTAKGPRDRRMRLSLDVARNFFDLQDMLGYDKASKTVEWLLVQARTEIKKLQIRCHPEMEIDSTGAKCASTTTTSDENIIDKATSAKIKERSSSSMNSIKKVKKTKHSRKIIHPLTKDSREKARARARERTSNKKRRTMSQEFDFDDESLKAAKCNSTDLNFAGSNQSATEARKKETRAQTQNKNHSWEVEEASSQVDQPVNEIIDVDAMVIMGKWSPSSYLHHIAIPQEHQFGDFQCFGKPYDQGS